MTLFFVPLASLVLGVGAHVTRGVASGANSAFRELGGVLGIAVLGAVFSAHGGYRSGQDYVNGMTPAVYVGAAVVAVGAVTALVIPGRRRAAGPSAASEPVAVAGGRGGRRARARAKPDSLGPVSEPVERVCAPAVGRRRPGRLSRG